MNGSIRVGNLFGIPFYLNPSWFLVFGLITLSYGGQLAQFPQLVGLMPWLLGAVAALLLFASVVAHELGHSFVALAQGIKVKSITLFLFGGLASLEKESDTPLKAFLIAIAGPVVSLLLFVLFAAISFNVTTSAPIAAILSLLASINLALAVFNLIPGLPLDGGNVLKALVWQITGNPNKGTIVASRVGQFIGWSAVIFGGLGTLGLVPFGNFWTLLIGFFLLQNAGFSAQSARVQQVMEGLTAEDAVIPGSPVVPETLNLREFANDYVIGQRQWHKFLVTDNAGQLAGTLETNDLKTVPTSQWTETPIQQLLRSPQNLRTVQSDLPLWEVIKMLEGGQNPQLTVVRKNGVIVGLLEKASILKLLQEKNLTKAA